MIVRFHPLRPGEFPQTGRIPRGDQFSSYWTNTLSLLEAELDKLGANDVVIQIAVSESDIRIDGWPRANAQPSHPGVIVSFDSRHGPLRYLTDSFLDWKANVRAIALGLQALRAVDRYGITLRGEQYSGWKQLTGSRVGPKSRAEAETLIAKYGDLKTALFQSHPDHGGSTEEFAAVQTARELLG